MCLGHKEAEYPKRLDVDLLLYLLRNLHLFELSIQIDPEVPKVTFIWPVTVIDAAVQTLESKHM